MPTDRTLDDYQTKLTFDRRFLDRYAGSIVQDPRIALVELVANCWDAYATKVEINWPEGNDQQTFSIQDNGIGMTPDEFMSRWQTLDYDRVSVQGKVVHPPSGLVHAKPRRPYGRNGKGRHAAFYFSNPYVVSTWRDGQEYTYEITRGIETPFLVKESQRNLGVIGHGTKISATKPRMPIFGAAIAREVIGGRFLFDPNFMVLVNGVEVSFGDLPKNMIKKAVVKIDGIGQAEVLMIDASTPGRSSRQMGIAWHVGKRLVGECKWRGSDYEKILDGRTSEAKKFTFIVLADFLEDAVKTDWSDFDNQNSKWLKTRPIVQQHIRDLISEYQSQERMV